MENKISNINDERGIRLKKMNDLINLGINPYPAQVKKSEAVVTALKKNDGEKVSLAGRLMTVREMGKLTFCHLQDETGKMQVVFKQGEITKESFDLFNKKVDPGDIIQLSGTRFATHKGEPSVLVQDWKLLTKTLLPLPDKFHGLQNEEIRLRKRYLEMIMNPEVREIFVRKSKFWNNTRQFLLNEGFLEVETPALEVTAGGASATPFVTHHNALDINVYLRISMGELWQKRLMVAGFEKTFEIGRQFRNEGMSREHLQDYTQMEFYWAYADYQMGMELVEKMIKHIAKETYDTLKFTIGDFGEIDLGKKWERYDYVETIKNETSIDVLKATDDELKKELKKLRVEYEKNEGRSSLIDALWKYCRRTLTGPGFLINVPVAVSPLAKRKEDNPELTQRFQIIIAGSELGNGYSELNDPLDQAKRFEEQSSMREAGDSEAQMHDQDFVEALEHGMPPTCGFGFSERVFSFLENKPIRECVMFPLMKPENNNQENAKIEIKIKPSKSLKLPITRDQAWEIINKYTKKQTNLNHYLESEAVMRALASHLNQDAEYWGMLGLLHDIDWEITEDDTTKHLTKAPDLLKKLGFDDNFIEIILSHGYGCDCANLNNRKRSEQLEFALACAETVTGLVYSAALMRPDKIATLDVKSIMKKFKDKKFAAKIDREVIKECEKLGLTLEEFLDLAIQAIRSIAKQIALV